MNYETQPTEHEPACPHQNRTVRKDEKLSPHRWGLSTYDECSPRTKFLTQERSNSFPLGRETLGTKEGSSILVDKGILANLPLTNLRRNRDIFSGLKKISLMKIRDQRSRDEAESGEVVRKSRRPFDTSRATQKTETY